MQRFNSTGDQRRPEELDRSAPVTTAAVLRIDTESAVRISIYLHPDDARLLRQGRVNDGIGANTRIRAMIALYRSNAEVRTRVDLLAVESPAKNGRQ